MLKFLCVKTFKKFTALTLSVALLLNPIAFATSSYIEVDSQESETADRLHTMMPLSNVQDISHIEIDSDEQRIRVYRDTETAEDNSDPETSARESVLDLSRDNVYNLPWHLGQEGLLYFLSQHTAWLTPLGDDDYRLEFTGRLLGGMWSSITTSDGGSVTTSSGDSVGYSNDYGGGSYSSDSGQCPSNFNLDSDGCARGSDGRTIPVFNITESTVVGNSNSGSSYTRDTDYGRSYGKSSGGSSSSYTSSSNSNNHNDSNDRYERYIDQKGRTQYYDKMLRWGDVPPCVQDDICRYRERESRREAAKQTSAPAPKPAAPKPTADLSKLYAQLNIKPPAKPAAKPVAPNLSKLFAVAKPPAKPAAKPVPKIDLFKSLAAAKPPAKPAKPAAKPIAPNLSKLFAVAKPPAKPAPKPIVIHPLIQQVKYRVNNQDPMSPHDFFDLEGKMGGAAMGGGGKPNWNRALGTKNQPSASQPARIVNPPKAESPVWKDLKPYRGQYKTDAKREKFYEWDHTHNEIEVYTPKGKHLGAMDPKTGKMIKPAEIGRTIQL